MTPRPIAPQPITSAASFLSGRPRRACSRPTAERLDHRGVIVGHAFGNLEQHVLVEQHQLAKAAGAFVAVADDLVRAFGRMTGTEVTRRPALTGRALPGPIVQHLADIFVARHERLREIERRIRPAELLRQVDDVAPALEEMLVRGAHPARMGAHQRLALGGTGSGISPTWTVPFST